MNNKYHLNDILQDNVSGFKGKCLGITVYSTGCIHYGLAPLKVKSDGTVANWEWFDETRIILIKTAKKEKILVPTSGPDMNNLHK